MIPPTPLLLIAVANAAVGLEDAGGDARAPLGDRFLAIGRKERWSGETWEVAFVDQIGYWSHFERRTRTSSWPLPLMASCRELGDFARRYGLLTSSPHAGDLFLLWSPTLKRFAHTGIVISVDTVRRTLSGRSSIACTAVGGATNDAGEYGAQCGSRRLVPGVGDRFIRWTDMPSGSERRAWTGDGAADESAA